MSVALSHTHVTRFGTIPMSLLVWYHTSTVWSHTVVIQYLYHSGLVLYFCLVPPLLLWFGPIPVLQSSGPGPGHVSRGCWCQQQTAPSPWGPDRDHPAPRTERAQKDRQQDHSGPSRPRWCTVLLQGQRLLPRTGLTASS